jgi:AsmA protein
LKRIFRPVLIGIAVLVVIAAGGMAAVLLTFDPNRYKPDIEAAVTRATGRTLTLNGNVSLQLSLTPTLRVADAAFANPPGFARPQMATLGALELQVALLPLISGHVHIDRLIMIKPDILLETNEAGQSNWQMTPQEPAAQPGAHGNAPPGNTPSGQASSGATSVSISTLSIQDGQVGLRDDRTGKVMTVVVRAFDAQAASPDAPLHVTMDGAYGGKAFNLVGDTGSLSRLQAGGDAVWPVKATLSTLGATLSVDGTLGLRTEAYNVAMSGTVPDLSAFNAFAPTAALPPVHDVSFDAKLSGASGAQPVISTLNAHAGAADLGSLLPGLTLTALEVKAPAADQPVQLDASGARGGAAFTLTGRLGTLASFAPKAKPVPFPVDVTLTSAGASLAVKGDIDDVAAQRGLNLGLNAQVPDVSALSPLAQRPLPPLKQVAFKATLTDGATSLRNGVQLKGMSLTSPDADLSGDVVLAFAPRPAVTATLMSNRINLDALETAANVAPKEPTAPATSTPAPAVPTPAPKPAAEPVKRDNHIFPETPIPFNVLRDADADVGLSVATLHASGTDTKALTLHVALKDGKLAVDRLVADLPAGHMNGSVTVDATQAAPPVHIQLHAPGLALKTLLAMTGEPQMATGNLEVYADLSGAGASPHAIASTLDGSLGLAVAGGTLDNRVMGSLLGRVLEAINLLDLVGKGGTSELRCFATHVRANHGVATIDPLALSSSLLTMSGSGSANLGSETLDLGLKPQVRMVATTLEIPVNVSGPMRAPAVAVNKVGAAEANAGTVAGALAGNATALGIVGGLLGANKAIGPTGGGDICPAALAAARGQAAPAQASTPQQKAPSSPKASNPADVLKGLFR